MAQKQKKQKPRWVTFRSVQSSPMNQSLKNQFFVSQLKTFSKDKSSLRSSQNNKQKCWQKSSVHELIADIRKNKWEIERLLMQEESKFQSSQLNQNQITTGFARLKKVSRLMKIVCGIILGKQQKNQSSNGSKFGSENRFQNPENSLERTKTKYNLTPSNRRVRASTFNAVMNKRDNLTISILQNQNDNQNEVNIRKFEPTSLEQQIQGNKKIQIGHKLTNSIKTSKFEERSELQICNDSISEQDSLSQGKKQVNLNLSNQFSVKIFNSSKSIKKIKSVLKITLSLMSMCNRMLSKGQSDSKFVEVDQKLHQISSYFNECYSLRAQKCNRQFYENIKVKVQSCFQIVHSRYKILCT